MCNNKHPCPPPFSEWLVKFVIFFFLNSALYFSISICCASLHFRNIEEIIAAKGEAVKRVEGSAALEIVADEFLKDKSEEPKPQSGDDAGEIIK